MVSKAKVMAHGTPISYHTETYINPIYHVSVDHKHKLCYCWTQTLWNAKISPIEKVLKKGVFHTVIEPRTTKTDDFHLPKVWWIYDLYELDCANDQLSHGKSIYISWMHSGWKGVPKISILSMKFFSPKIDNFRARELIFCVQGYLFDSWKSQNTSNLLPH